MQNKILYLDPPRVARGDISQACQTITLNIDIISSPQTSQDHQPFLNDEDDTAGWTTVTNIRKKKQHNKKLNSSEENTTVCPVLDQSTLSITDGEWEEWHINLGQRRPKKCRKNPHYSGNKAAPYLKHHSFLHFRSNGDGSSKHRFKSWEMDIIVLTRRAAVRFTQHSSAVAHKETPRYSPA